MTPDWLIGRFLLYPPLPPPHIPPIPPISSISSIVLIFARRSPVACGGSECGTVAPTGMRDGAVGNNPARIHWRMAGKSTRR